MARPTIHALPLNSIRTDADTQSREDVSWELVNEYADAWLKQADFPPVDVFKSADGEHVLADGFHRLLAAKKVAKPTILCRVFHGDSRAAFLFACTQNHSHGLRRTNADKRYMVTRILNDAEWVSWTDARIAEQCGVSHTFVTALRRELESVNGSAASQAKYQAREGADGKHYPSDRKRSSRSSNNSLPNASNDNASKAVDRTAGLKAVGQLRLLLQRLNSSPRFYRMLDQIEATLNESTKA